MPDSAYQITKTLLATNDVVFALSTGSNSGIINAARNYTEQRYVVGVDTDQSWMGLNVVTGSVVKLFGADIYEYIELFSKGNFNDGHFIRSMEDGKTEFLMNDIVMGGMKIPQELIKIAVDKENQMIQP
jgi:basic membrane lipoprotein Med (substrate-binding protein (PBP1-ABC) superfamily)